MQKDVSANETVRPDRFFRRILRQGRNYSTIIGWLLYRAFSGQHWRLAMVLAFSVLHLATQAAAIFIIYWYGRQMEQSGLVTVPFLNLQFSLKDDPHWLWAIVAVATVCFAVSAALLYLSRKQILDILERFYAKSLQQLIRLTLRVPDPRVPFASRMFMEHGFGGLSIGCRYGTLSAITSANAVAPMIGGLGAAFFLFRIDLPLTLVIVGAALLATVFLYPLTLRASRSAKEREKAQATMRSEIRKLSETPAVDPATTRLKSVDGFARAFVMRRRVLTEIVFATEIGITVLLGIVIYYMASRALAGKEQWAVFIAYIGALRMTLVGASAAVRAFASVSRYYPQIVRYYLFVKDMPKLDKTPLAELRSGDEVSLGTLPNGEDVIAEVGDRLAILGAGSTREPMFALVGAKLVGSGEPVASASVDPANLAKTAAGIAIVASGKLRQVPDPDAVFAALKDKVSLIFYQAADEVGSFGEKRVLTTRDGELWRAAVLGTEEGEAVLKEYALKAPQTKAKTIADEEDEEEV